MESSTTQGLNYSKFTENELFIVWAYKIIHCKGTNLDFLLKL